MKIILIPVLITLVLPIIATAVCYLVKRSEMKGKRQPVSNVKTYRFTNRY